MPQAPHAPQHPTRLPEPPEVHEDHGHSTAAWTGTILMIVGSVVIALGIVLPNDVMTYAGVALTVVGALAWPIMAKMGFGSKHGQ